MTMIEPDKLSIALTERFGLPVSVDANQVNSGKLITIYPSEAPSTITFKIEIVLGWRRITATFIPGNFASELMTKISGSTLDQRLAFKVFACSLIERGAELEMRVDDQQIDPLDLGVWPLDWGVMSLSMKKIGIVVESKTDYDFEITFPWVTGFFGMVISLLPLENSREKMLGVDEGKAIYQKIKTYERSPINRAACIEIRGTACSVCGFIFSEKYGEIGSGFIHVHHLIPVSQMGEEYHLNPADDLVPVCPNCHAMLHRNNPPYSLKELREILV